MATLRGLRRQAQEADRQKKALAKMSDGACELVFVRHGETDWNVQGRLQGQLLPGPPLNATGKRQARALAARLAGEQFHALYTSDLDRAVETLDFIRDQAHAHRLLPVHKVPELRERKLGVLQGFTARQAQEAQPRAYNALKIQGAQSAPAPVSGRVFLLGG